MLIVYLYGIYPEGGISVSLGSIAGINLFILGMMWVSNEEGTGQLFKRSKLLYIVTMIVWTVGYFIPSKNIFLAMVATPMIIESLESKTGKLNKIDKLLDKALDVALETTGEKDD